LEQFYYNEDLLQGYVTEFATNRVTDMSFETNQGDLQMALKSMDIQADLLKSKYEASYDYIEEFLNPSKPQTAEYREVLFNLSKPALMEQNLVPATEEGLEMTVEEFDAIQASSRSLLGPQEFKPEKVVLSDFDKSMKQLDSELDGYIDQYTVLAEAHYANDPNKLALFNKGFLGKAFRALLITALQKGKDPLSQDPTFMGDQQLNTIRQKSMQTAAELGTMQSMDQGAKEAAWQQFSDAFDRLNILDESWIFRLFRYGADYITVEGTKYAWNPSGYFYRDETKQQQRKILTSPVGAIRSFNELETWTETEEVDAPPISLDEMKQLVKQTIDEGGNVTANVGGTERGKERMKINSLEVVKKALGDALLLQSELYMTPTITAESAGGKEIIREAYQAAAQTGQLTNNFLKRIVAAEDGVIPEDLTNSSLGFNLMGSDPSVIILEGGAPVGELYFSDIPTATSLEFVAYDAYDAVQMKQTYDWYDGYLEPGETIPAIVSNPIPLAGSDGKMYTQRTKVEVKKGNSSNQYYVQLVNTVHDEQGQVYKQPFPGSYGSFTEILFDGMAFSDLQTAMNAAAQIDPEMVQSYVTPVISE
jgi:hypothetical protein